MLIQQNFHLLKKFVPTYNNTYIPTYVHKYSFGIICIDHMHVHSYLAIASIAI